MVGVSLYRVLASTEKKDGGSLEYEVAIGLAGSHVFHVTSLGVSRCFWLSRVT